jgi:hypothetical protein
MSSPSDQSTVKNIVLGVGGYVIKHNNIRARDINLFRNDGTHLSDIGINVYYLQQG